MSKREWTPAQKTAITASNTRDAKKCNILVSAAAGSGKTAVLVERIIKKILPEDGGIGTDINRLLVVTFTNAAAREMKDRINDALSLQLKEARISSDSEKILRIKQQQLLLHTADITTIDAFCMKLVREYFNILDIDPGFSIADSGQAAILSEEAIEELFDLLYNEKNHGFMELLDLYSTASSHRQLAGLVSYIYNYTRSIPFPLNWLAEKTEALKYENTSLRDSSLYKETLTLAKSKLKTALKTAEKALSIICETTLIDEFVENNPPEKKVEVFELWGSVYKAFYLDYILLRQLVASDEPQKIIKNHSFSSLSFNKRISEDDKNYFKFVRENIKDTIRQVEKELSVCPEDAQDISRKKIYPVALALSELVREFDKIYMTKKSAKNILEFHDVEQLTAELFEKNPHIAEQIKSRYDEILMDEYQDTSLLQEEIFKRIKKEDNLFTVGDMKQSIYRFRSSDPYIFKEKIDTYSPDEDALSRKIILSHNFRSRGPVLSGINDVFEAIMTETAGELDYDESQRLNLLKESYDDLGQDHKSEFIVIEADDTEDTDSVRLYQQEARFIASEIIRMKKEGFKVRTKEGYRPVENRDFTILLSKYKNIANVYADVLNEAGIDCYAESCGYFDQSEIRLMMSLLDTIINPYSDIPLIGVLRSPIASFSDDEVVIIRKCKKGKFYSALKEIIQLNKKGVLKKNDEITAAEKSEAFLENLGRWRSYSRYMTTDKLIWTLYEETDFYAFCGGMYDGEASQANLRLLFLRAKQYEDNGFKGLFSFVKYLDNLKQRETDLTSAKLLNESHDTVQIMTIHKSKGLEMPVVFIAGTGDDFGGRSDSSGIVLHKSHGIGLDFVDYEHRFRTETLEKKLIKTVIAREEVSEEIRKLYVAMTRAKEKLYVVSAFKFDALNPDNCPIGKKLLLWENSTETGTPSLTPFDVLSAKCYADWVAPVAMCSEHWHYRKISSSALSAPDTITRDREQKDTALDIDALLSYSYPYTDATMLPTKVTVSQLKENRDTIMAPLPGFLSNKTESGAFYGTATHNFIKYITLTQDMTPEYITAQLELLTSSGTISPEEAKKINIQKIYDFFASSLGQRMLASKNVMREQPFEVILPANRLYPESDSEENIILQGVIDCYFEEDDGLVLVDYKTDSFKSVVEIHQKYDLQLDLYKLALEKITKKKVKNKFFYLFFDNSVL